MDVAENLWFTLTPEIPVVSVRRFVVPGAPEGYDRDGGGFLNGEGDAASTHVPYALLSLLLASLQRRRFSVFNQT